MKQLIDIPEEIMEYIKNNGCLSVIYNNEVVKAIINGTPVSTEGDLISREELKKELNEIFDTVEVVTFDDIIDVIDNAPTVNTENCEGCPYCPNSNSGIPIGVE